MFDIEFKKTLHEDDNTGELYVRYTPVLVGNGILCTGSISFAAYDVGVGEPIAAHNAAKESAKVNARDVLARIQQLF